MSKTYRAWDVDQEWLLPPSIDDFVPAAHPAHFVRDVVRESLDLGAIMAPYEREERGQPPYHPAMMVALLLYAYSRGVYSSRRIARACEERLDFMAVTALQKPDFRTVSDFRKRHLEALAGLFVQVLSLCRQAGLVKLGHVALDGTKIKANASKHKAMSYGRMVKAEAELAAAVAGWVRRAAELDAAEDRRYGPERRGDEMPDWVADKQRRLAKIRHAKAVLEAEARAAAAASDGADRDGEGATPRRKPKHPPGAPKASAQRNFTDPDSRIMNTKDGFIQGYNAQAAVDVENQVIVACGLTNNASDQYRLVPMVDAVAAAAGKSPGELSADADFCSEANLRALEERRIRAYIATGRHKHSDTAATGRRKTVPRTRVHAMAVRLKRGGRRSRYRLRKQTVEPVFGQIKQARGFRQFLLRGLEKVADEWSLVCTAHNLLKLAAA